MDNSKSSIADAAAMPLILNTLLKNRSNEQSFELRMALLDDENLADESIVDYFNEDDLAKVRQIHSEKIQEWWEDIKAHHHQASALAQSIGTFNFKEVLLNAVGVLPDDEQFASLERRDEEKLNKIEALHASDDELEQESETWEKRLKRMYRVLKIPEPVLEIKQPEDDGEESDDELGRMLGRRKAPAARETDNQKPKSEFAELAEDAQGLAKIAREFGEEINSPTTGKALAVPALVAGAGIAGTIWAIGKAIDWWEDQNI